MQITAATISSFSSSVYADNSRFRTPVIIDAEVVERERQAGRSPSAADSTQGLSFSLARPPSLNVVSSIQAAVMPVSRQLPVGVRYYLQVDSLSLPGRNHQIDETV